MNNQEWINDVVSEDLYKPAETVSAELPVYTLTMKEFLNMPVLDYWELAKTDPYLRSLLN